MHSMRLRAIVLTALAPMTLAGCDWAKSILPGAKKSEVAVDRVDVVPKGGAGDQIVTVGTRGPAVSIAGVTPMQDRIAVLGLLNKRNGQARDITLKPGQTFRTGDVIIRLRACEKTAPFETEQYTGAFAQVDVRGNDSQWRRIFSGWLFKERPALNVVPHPIYDVWVKSCAMTFPDTGGETVDGGSRESGKPVAKPSSAPKSADTTAAPVDRPAAPSPSESDKSDR